MRHLTKTLTLPMENKSIFIPARKSAITIGEIYFWTATINNWQKLLYKAEYKNVILNSLDYLSNAGKLDVFAFVIMPNHIHLIWRINEKNGKESSQGSFLKFTAHEFKKLLNHDPENQLASYEVDLSNKRYEFWQRDSLAIHLRSPKVAYQKLQYIHANPCVKHWQLAKEPSEYEYSSAGFYELGKCNFSFLKDMREIFPLHGV